MVPHRHCGHALLSERVHPCLQQAVRPVHLQGRSTVSTQSQHHELPLGRLPHRPPALPPHRSGLGRTGLSPRQPLPIAHLLVSRSHLPQLHLPRLRPAPPEEEKRGMGKTSHFHQPIGRQFDQESYFRSRVPQYGHERIDIEPV